MILLLDWMKDSFIIEKIILNIVNDEWMIKENDLMVACELCHLMLGAGGGIVGRKGAP